jgi:hypothetical protein
MNHRNAHSDSDIAPTEGKKLPHVDANVTGRIMMRISNAKPFAPKLTPDTQCRRTAPRWVLNKLHETVVEQSRTIRTTIVNN